MSDYRSEPSIPSVPATIPTLVLVRDLMFTGRITAEARAFGVSIEVILDPALLASKEGSWLIVDLNLSGAIESSASWKSRRTRDKSLALSRTSINLRSIKQERLDWIP